MKKLLFNLIGVLWLALAFVSCSSDGESFSDADLIGCWVQTHETGWDKVNGKIDDEWDDEYTSVEYKLYINEDGTWSEQEYYNRKWNLTLAGTWKLKSNKLSVVLTYDIDDDAEYTNVVATILTLDETTLIMEFSRKEKYDGDTYEEYFKATFRRFEDD